MRWADLFINHSTDVCWLLGAAFFVVFEDALFQPPPFTQAVTDKEGLEPAAVKAEADRLAAELDDLATKEEAPYLPGVTPSVVVELQDIVRATVEDDAAFAVRQEESRRQLWQIARDKASQDASAARAKARWVSRALINA